MRSVPAIPRAGHPLRPATRLRLYRSFYRGYLEIGRKLPDALAPDVRPARIQPTLSVESASTDTAPRIRPTPSDELAAVEVDRRMLAESVIALTRQFPLGWSHYVELLIVDSAEERRFYEIEAAANQWGVRELRCQIATSLYERLALSRDEDEIRRLATEGALHFRRGYRLTISFSGESVDSEEEGGHVDSEAVWKEMRKKAKNTDISR